MTESALSVGDPASARSCRSTAPPCMRCGVSRLQEGGFKRSGASIQPPFERPVERVSEALTSASANKRKVSCAHRLAALSAVAELGDCEMAGAMAAAAGPTVDLDVCCDSALHDAARPRPPPRPRRCRPTSSWRATRTTTMPVNARGKTTPSKTQSATRQRPAETRQKTRETQSRATVYEDDDRTDIRWSLRRG